MSRNIDVNVGATFTGFFVVFLKHFICGLVTSHQEADEQLNRTSGVESFGVLYVLSDQQPFRLKCESIKADGCGVSILPD